MSADGLESFSMNEEATPNDENAEIRRQADEIECIVAERRDHIRNMRTSKKTKYPEEMIRLAEVRLETLRRAARTMRAVANNAAAVRLALRGGSRG